MGLFSFYNIQKSFMQQTELLYTIVEPSVRGKLLTATTEHLSFNVTQKPLWKEILDGTNLCTLKILTYKSWCWINTSWSESLSNDGTDESRTDRRWSFSVSQNANKPLRRDKTQGSLADLLSSWRGCSTRLSASRAVEKRRPQPGVCCSFTPHLGEKRVSSFSIFLTDN